MSFERIRRLQPDPTTNIERVMEIKRILAAPATSEYVLKAPTRGAKKRMLEEPEERRRSLEQEAADILYLIEDTRRLFFISLKELRAYLSIQEHLGEKGHEFPFPGQYLTSVYFAYYGDRFRDFKDVDIIYRTPQDRLVFIDFDVGIPTERDQRKETERMNTIATAIGHNDTSRPSFPLHKIFWLRIDMTSKFLPLNEMLVGMGAFTKLVIKFANDLPGLANSRRSGDDSFQIGYAFYECDDDGTPLVLKDDGYHPTLRNNAYCVTPSIATAKFDGKLVVPPQTDVVSRGYVKLDDMISQ